MKTRVQTIPIESISSSEGGRDVDETHVRNLADSMLASDFLSALLLRPVSSENQKIKYTVVGGDHRLAAAKQQGLKVVHAVIVEDATEIQLALARIDANLLHRRQSPALEAQALAARKKLFQAQFPESQRGGDRRSAKSKGQLGTSKKSFATSTSAATGKSARAVNRAAARAKRSSPQFWRRFLGQRLIVAPHWMSWRRCPRWSSSEKLRNLLRIGQNRLIRQEELRRI
jgi:hypothetical protein